MKKGTTSAPTNPAPGKGAATTQPPKGKPAPKPFNADDYVSLTVPREEVLDIRTAFEIFDQDGSGIIDPLELKQSFIELGFTGGKFIYQILAELDEDQSEVSTSLSSSDSPPPRSARRTPESRLTRSSTPSTPTDQ